ncbi:Uncharacterised protein [Mycobacterium tuberculosis]|nr:Uncharacterised protein [Mycobacterium tuberculosis]
MARSTRTRISDKSGATNGSASLALLTNMAAACARALGGSLTNPRNAGL